MRPGKGLTRKVAMAARSVPMTRTELRRGKPLERGTPLARPGRHRAKSPAAKRADAGEDQAKDTVRGRASDVDGWPLCELCGAPTATQYQHRKRRPHCTRAERWDPRNGLAVCDACHRLIHHDPIVAKDYGWEVPQGLDPAEQPVWRRGVWVQLVTADVDVRLWVPSAAPVRDTHPAGCPVWTSDDPTTCAEVRP